MTDLKRIRDNLQCALNMGGLREAAEWAVAELDKMAATYQFDGQVIRTHDGRYVAELIAFDETLLQQLLDRAR